MTSEITRTLRQQGNHVLMKEVVEPLKLTAFDVLMNIDKNITEINKAKQQLAMFEPQKKQLEEGIARLEKSTKDFQKHEIWAMEIQESKLKVIVDEIKAEVEKRVRDEYEQDDALTAEQNNIQMFHQYKEYICRHSKIGSAIAGRIVSVTLRKKGYLANPFS